MRKLTLLAAAATAAFTATPALATVSETFSISLDGSSGTNLGTGPYGTITVTDNGDGTLTFVESLLSGYGIHETTSVQHEAFSFSILGDPALTITGLPSGFTAVNTGSGSGGDQPPFGTFQTSIACATTACGHGSPGYLSPLSFTVSAGTALTLASLGFNVVGGNNVYFSTDLVFTNGNSSFTGNAGATLQSGPPVPEPATWAMMLIGFGAIGFSMRRNRSKALLTQIA